LDLKYPFLQAGYFIELANSNHSDKAAAMIGMIINSNAPAP
jgi:hypothetical protein